MLTWERLGLLANGLFGSEWSWIHCWSHNWMLGDGRNCGRWSLVEQSVSLDSKPLKGLAHLQLLPLYLSLSFLTALKWAASLCIICCPPWGSVSLKPRSNRAQWSQTEPRVGINLSPLSSLRCLVTALKKSDFRVHSSVYSNKLPFEICSRKIVPISIQLGEKPS